MVELPKGFPTRDWSELDWVIEEARSLRNDSLRLRQQAQDLMTVCRRLREDAEFIMARSVRFEDLRSQEAEH